MRPNFKTSTRQSALAENVTHTVKGFTHRPGTACLTLSYKCYGGLHTYCSVYELIGDSMYKQETHFLLKKNHKTCFISKICIVSNHPCISIKKQTES